jgi:hypothetical protein
LPILAGPAINIKEKKFFIAREEVLGDFKQVKRFF